MKIRKGIARSMIIGVLLAGVISVSGAGYKVNAEELNVKSSVSHVIHLRLTGGDLRLDVPEIVGFGKVKLGERKELTTSFADRFTVTDARGTGEGWRLSVRATQFTEVEPEGGFKEGTGHLTLPEGSLTLSKDIEVGQINTTDGIEPSHVMSEDKVIDSGESVLVVEAFRDEGMGKYGVEFGENALKLLLDPSNVRLDGDNYKGAATPYESTLTWELVTGL